MLMLFAGGIIIRKFDGFKMRHLNMLNGDVATLTIGADRSAQQEACGVAEAQKHLFQFCLSDKREAPRLAVLGDSKAEALYYGLARESAPGMRWLLIGSVWAPKEDAQADDRQQLKNRLAFQSVTDNPSIKLVALVVAMRDIFPVNGETGFIEGNADASAIDIYSRAIRQLEQAGKRVVFVLDNPTFPDPRSCINGGLTSNPLLNKFLWRKSKSRCTISYTDHLAGTDAYRRFVAELGQRNPGLTVYDPTPLLCDIRGDRCTITRDGKFLYSYADHISDYANSLIAHDLLPAVYRLVR
jgi:hypothetical protein